MVIIGSGPAGMQAALLLARTRKKIVVFDAPAAPRNGASHGVHNFLGLDGMLPDEIREQAWSQINSYPFVVLRRAWVTDVALDGAGGFVVSAGNETVTARVVILAAGYTDIYPDLDGFMEAWADSIIPCPFCDGYENRDRIWGLVAQDEMQLNYLPKMLQHWASKIKVILHNNQLDVEPAYAQELARLGITLHRGQISAIQQSAGKLEAVTLGSGARVVVETLWWILPREKTALTRKLITGLGLETDEQGRIVTDEMHQTNVPGLFAVGDVLEGKANAIGAAMAGNTAAAAIVHGWFV